MLHEAIARLEGAYSPATIRAYFADFATFIAFCESHNQAALPADPLMVCGYIAHVSTPGRSSASVRRAVVGVSAIRLFNRMTDPELIARIGGHPFRVGAAQDLLASGASIPTIMHRGRWNKSDTVMRYMECLTEIE